MGHRINNRCDTEGFPLYLIEDLIKEYRVPCVLECGTAGGESTRLLAQHFERVTTIELIENRAIVDASLKNATWLTGNTVDLLPSIINDLISEKLGMQSIEQDAPPIYNYAVFFMDAHYSGSEPNTTGYPECPLLQELEIISKYNADAVLIIDDLRLFCGQPPAPLEPREWPSVSQIFALLHEKYPHNTSTIRDDYIISYPSRLDEPFDREWRSNYTVRYPNASDKLLQETKNVYQSFLNYIK